MNKISFFLIASIIAGFVGCAPTSVGPGQVDRISDENPCPRPPANVLKALDFDLDLAVNTLPKIPSGSLGLQTDPKIFKTVSQAVLDSRTAGYVRCLSIKVEGYTPAQAAWLQTMADFKNTNPTPEQFNEFLKEHPFPNESISGDSYSKTDIKTGDIENTGGSVQVGTNQTIGSTDANKKPASTSSAGDTSISVDNIKGTKGNVQIGSNQAIHPENAKPEK